MRSPDDDELEALLTRLVRRLERVLRPLLEQPAAGDAQASDYAAAVQAVLPVGDDEPVRKKRLTAFQLGYSLNAATHLHAHDREALERLCRYGARPPFALERLAQRPDGQVTYRLRHPRAGIAQLVLAPTEFLRKLATLIPPPRHHLTRFHGCLAPNAKWRREVVPAPSAEPAACSPPPPPAETASPPTPANDDAPAPSRIPWAELLERVYRADVLKCDRCGGRMTMLAFITERAVVRQILDHLGIPSTGPPIAPARSRPQVDLDAWQGDLAFDDGPSAS